MGKHNKQKWFDFKGDKDKAKAPEEKPKTREELFKDYQAAATGLVQRMSIIAKLQDEVQKLSQSIGQIEAAINALPQEQPQTPQQPLPEAK